ncbi:MAG: hypothetical protein ABSH22_14705 [Tepidisphaeraceae bacterium]|jgi:hypothetical protein
MAMPSADDITWSMATRAWAACFWRFLLTFAALLVATTILFAMVAGIAVPLGLDRQLAFLLFLILVFLAACFASFFALKLVIGRDFGSYRLVMLGQQSLDDYSHKYS